MHAAHGHRVAQLAADLFDVGCHALRAVAVDHRHEWAADEHGVRAECQRLEHVRAGADAAVDENLHAAAHSVGNLRQDLGAGRRLTEHAAAVVGHDDCRSARLGGLLRAAHGHDALDDERHAGIADDLRELLHGLAAGRRRHILQEGEARAVNVHGDGLAAAGSGQIELFKNQFLIPRLDRRHADAACCADGFHRALEHGSVHTVAGEGGDAAVGTGVDEDAVILAVGVLFAVVQLHRAERGREKRIAVHGAEQLHSRIDRFIRADGVHVDADLLPGVEVADKAAAGRFGAGAGDLVAAGFAVADRAGLAVRPDAGACAVENLFVLHEGTSVYLFLY